MFNTRVFNLSYTPKKKQFVTFHHTSEAGIYYALTLQQIILLMITQILKNIKIDFIKLLINIIFWQSSFMFAYS